MQVEPTRPLDADEPIAWLRAYTEGAEPRVLPLFRRPARVTVGSGKACDWRFEAAELAELEMVLAWDGVRLRAEDATRPAASATVRNGQSVVAGASGRLRIALDLVFHDDEVTMIRKLALPEAVLADETTAPIPLAPPPASEPDPADDDQRTRITIALPPVAPPAAASPAAASPAAASPAAASPAAASPATTPSALAPAPGDITAAHPWRIYLPPRNGAADGEPTREWPLDDTLRPTADLLDRLGKRGLRTLARRAPPRRIALWGALAVVVAIEAFMLLRPRRVVRPPLVQAAPASAHVAVDRRSRIMLPDKHVEVALHHAIADYRAGKTAEALTGFAHLAEETNDPAARTMLFVLRSRGAGTP